MSRRAAQRSARLISLDHNEISTSAASSRRTPRRAKIGTHVFCLPKEEARDIALQAFQPFANLDIEVSKTDLLGQLTSCWSATLQHIEGRVFEKFFIEKVLATGQVLLERGETLGFGNKGLSQLLKGFPYYAKEAGFERNMRAAIIYQKEISKCLLEIGNSAHGIPLMNHALSWFLKPLQESYLPDGWNCLNLPEFELLRPAMLIYLLLGGAQSPIQFADIVGIIEPKPEPFPSRQYQFLPFFGEQRDELGRQYQEAITDIVTIRKPNCDLKRLDCWKFANLIRKASAKYIAAWASTMGLLIPNLEQATDEYIISLPKDRQWEASSVEVALVIPYSTAPLTVILGSQDSEPINWPPGSALLLTGTSLWFKKQDWICTMVWMAEKKDQ